MVRYGQRRAGDPGFGSDVPGGYGSDPLTAPGPFSSSPSGPQRPLGSATEDPLGTGSPSTGSRSAFSSGPRRALGPGPQVPQASPESGPNGAVGYGEGGTGAYHRYGDEEPARSGWSDPGQQPGYADQAGYGDQPGYGSAAQSRHAQQDFLDDADREEAEGEVPDPIVVVARQMKRLLRPVAERRLCVRVIAAVDEDQRVQEDGDVTEVAEPEAPVGRRERDVPDQRGRDHKGRTHVDDHHGYI